MESRSIERIGEIMKYTVNAIALLAYLMIGFAGGFAGLIVSIIPYMFIMMIVLLVLIIIIL